MDGGDVQARCAQCGAPLGEDGRAMPEAAPAPRPGPLSVQRCLSTLAAGLLPIVGLVCCLVWAYGRGYALGRRNLAKALLWVHGFVLVVAIIALCVWVLVLAERYALFSQAVL